MKLHMFGDETKKTCTKAEATDLETPEEEGLLLWLIIPTLSSSWNNFMAILGVSEVMVPDRGNSPHCTWCVNVSNKARHSSGH